MTLQSSVNEKSIHDFWQYHPCGDTDIERLVKSDAEALQIFFDEYDAWRYSEEFHIPACLDAIDLKNKRILEIGLGQGADSEQLVRRGAMWSGLDLTEQAVNRVKARLKLKGLPYEDVRQGSALENPYPDNRFDIVFCHGVLHHIPDVRMAQREIHRVLKPDGELIIMMYAKWSTNYFLSIALVRRLRVLYHYFFNPEPGGIMQEHVRSAKKMGLFAYLRMKHFVHKNTDGPLNPYSKVYNRKLLKKDFPDFSLGKTYKRFMRLPFLKGAWLPGGKMLGWHLWAHLHPEK